MKKIYTPVLFFACFISFGWGFLCHRHQLFPHSAIHWVAIKLGLYHETAAVVSRSRSLALLSSLPYLHANFDPQAEDSGVVISTPEAFPGYNFYNSYQESSAFLVDMNGEVLHSWYHVFPGREWHHAELLSDGGVLVVLQDHGVARLDKHSNQIWYLANKAHHDLWIHSDEYIYTITSESKRIPTVNSRINSSVDNITVLSLDGVAISEMSIFEILQRSPYRFLLPSLADRAFNEEVDTLDILHTNHVEVFDGSLESKSSLYKRGNILISIKHLNSIVIIDGDSRELVWLWGPTNLDRQHHPRLLENGNILLFDNGISESRVVEVSPVSGVVTWAYANGKAFFSSWGGAVQRLSNGNTLITNSSAGRVFEVNSAGTVVWEFANPKVDNEGKRTNIWRMSRFEENDLRIQALLGPQ